MFNKLLWDKFLIKIRQHTLISYKPCYGKYFHKSVTFFKFSYKTVLEKMAEIDAAMEEKLLGEDQNAEGKKEGGILLQSSMYTF